MSSIEELQERVSAAEARFGLINEARVKYSERLVGLIDAIESRLRDQGAEIERQEVELAAQGEALAASRNAEAENQALRGMLHSLLQAIEAGGRDVLSETMQTMDAKVSALISENVKPVAALGHLEAALPEAIPSPLPELEAPALDPEPEVEMAAEAEPEPEAPEAPAADALEDGLGDGLGDGLEYGAGAVPEELEIEAAAETEPMDEAPEDVAPEDEASGDAGAALELDPASEMPEEPPVAASEAPEVPVSTEGEVWHEAPESESAAADAALLEQFAPLDEAPLEDVAPEADTLSAPSDEMVSEESLQEAPVHEESVPEEVVPDDLLDAQAETTELDAPPAPTGEDEAFTILEAPEPPEAPESPEAVSPDLAAPDEVLTDETLTDETLTEEVAPEPQAEADAETDLDFDDPGEAASLEDIMRRVSRLVEEEGLDEAAPAGDAGLEGGTEDTAPQSVPDKAASNG